MRLKQLLSDASHNIIDVKGIEKAVEARNPFLWYDLYDYFMKGCLLLLKCKISMSSMELDSI